MRPVLQTRVGRRGNCYQACVASILEVPIDEVPDQALGRTPEEYVHILRGWLAPRGLSLIAATLGPYTPEELLPELWHAGYWIAGIATNSRDLDHAVVMRGNTVVWDPHPTPHNWEPYVANPHINGIAMFVPLDPAQTFASAGVATTS